MNGEMKDKSQFSRSSAFDSDNGKIYRFLKECSFASYSHIHKIPFSETGVQFRFIIFNSRYFISTHFTAYKLEVFEKLVLIFSLLLILRCGRWWRESQFNIIIINWQNQNSNFLMKTSKLLSWNLLLLSGNLVNVYYTKFIQF